MVPQDQPVPIFPLPDCVVFPGVVQGLHIFEPRYRCMMQDVLQKKPPQRLIAMALLMPGYEANYCNHHAPIHPALCLGRIIRYETLSDGRYNVLLEGIARVTILKEQFEQSYRSGSLQSMQVFHELDSDEHGYWKNSLKRETAALGDPAGRIAAELIEREPNIVRSADMLAYYLLPRSAASAKQMILSEPRIIDRLKMLRSLIRKMAQEHIPAHCERGLSCSNN